MAEPKSRNATQESSSERSRGIIGNLVRQVIEEPITTLGTAAAVAALFVANPEILGLPEKPTVVTAAAMNDSGGLVTWVLLSAAVSFCLAKWGSLIARRRWTSGYMIAPIFGLISVVISCYLASKYLASFPLNALVEKGLYGQKQVTHVWVGLNLVTISLIMSLMWTFALLTLYVPELIDLVDRYNYDDSDGAFGAIIVIGSLLVLASFLFLWAVAYSLLLGLVIPIEVVAAT